MTDERSDAESVDVSVVIPFGGGDDLLAQQLAAVDASIAQAWSAAGVRSEIIVSANSRLADSGQSAFPGTRSPLRVIDSTDRRGAPHARNVGVAQARGALILFCDSDDLVDEQWVTAMVEQLRSHDVVAGGHELRSLNPRAAAPLRTPSTGPSHPYHWLPCGPSSNLAISRELFTRIGGFDEDLRTSEDLDLCWRAQYAGGSFGWVETPLVRYRWRDTLSGHMRQTYRWGRDSADIVRKHRPYGLKPSIAGGLADVAGAIPRVGMLLFLPSRRWNAAGHVARTWGRIAATVREGVWAVGG